MGAKVNLICDQGTTFSNQFQITDDDGNAIDLSSYTGAAQFRKYYTSSNSTSFAVSLSGNTGIVTISLTANQTANTTAGRYVYDVEVTDGDGVVSRIAEGQLTITPEVTR